MLYNFLFSPISFSSLFISADIRRIIVFLILVFITWIDICLVQFTFLWFYLWFTFVVFLHVRFTIFYVGLYFGISGNGGILISILRFGSCESLKYEETSQKP